MDDGLKQRLVGALILLALGVLFLPVLFEPEHRRALDRTSQIPPAPGIEPIEVAEPVRNPQVAAIKETQEQFLVDDQSGGYRLLSDEETASQLSNEPEPVNPPAPTGAQVESQSASDQRQAAPAQAQPKDIVASKPQPERKVLDAEGMPNAWVVQVASFSTEKRAQVLRDQLLQDDYPAFTRSLNTAKGAVTRVYVGPKINRDAALATKAELDKSLKIDALVVRFSP